MGTAQVYLLGARRCRVLISPNQRRKDLPRPLPLLRLRPYPPRNVLVEFEDGSCVVRPFRGLRRADA
jgi:hypothetical protein